MGDKPLTRKLAPIFAAVAAIGAFSPYGLHNEDGLTAKAAEPVATYQTLKPVGEPAEHVDRMSTDGGKSTGFGGGGGMPYAMAIKLGRPGGK